jgi:hypothetical protein
MDTKFGYPSCLALKPNQPRCVSVLLQAFKHGLTHTDTDTIKELLETGWRLNRFSQTYNKLVNHLFTDNFSNFFFGRKPETEEYIDNQTEFKLIKERLNPADKSIYYVENLPLILHCLNLDGEKLNLNKIDFTINAENETIKFGIKSAELWFFNDNGAILSLNLDCSNICNIRTQSILHKHIRTILKESPVNCSISYNSNSLSDVNFWEFIAKYLLGFNKSGKTNYLDYHSVKDDNYPESLINDFYNAKNGHSKHAKIIIGVGISKPSEEQFLQWNNNENLTNNDWLNSNLSSSDLTYHDLLLTELGTASIVGKATNSTDNFGLLSFKLKKTLINNHRLDYFEYWSALLVRDTAVFLSFDENQPLLEYIENYYYYLYLHVYHIRNSLDSFVNPTIDPDFLNLNESRKKKYELARFKSDLWLEEVGRDTLSRSIFDGMKNGMEINESYTYATQRAEEISLFVNENIEFGVRNLIGFFALMVPGIQIFPYTVVIYLKLLYYLRLTDNTLVSTELDDYVVYYSRYFVAYAIVLLWISIRWLSLFLIFKKALSRSKLYLKGNNVFSYVVTTKNFCIYSAELLSKNFFIEVIYLICIVLLCLYSELVASWLATAKNNYLFLYAFNMQPIFANKFKLAEIKAQ